MVVFMLYYDKNEYLKVMMKKSMLNPALREGGSWLEAFLSMHGRRPPSEPRKTLASVKAK